MQDSMVEKIVVHNRLAKEIDELYQMYAKKSGMSETAFWILYCVRERKEPYTQKELCDLWSYSRQTINSALKNMQAQGLYNWFWRRVTAKTSRLCCLYRGKSW